MESERTQWEQRYLEETAMRQVAIDAASIPKDAKIAALEKTSAESEKLIADARNDKMRQFEDMQNAQVRKYTFDFLFFPFQKIRQITAHTHCYFTRLKSKEIGPF